MSVTLRRGIVGLTGKIVCRGLLIHDGISSVRLKTVRLFAMSPSGFANMSDADKEVKSMPIKFSTSKASHRTWKVKRSFGNEQQRPWWTVWSISLVITCFILWCVLGEETDTDTQLEPSQRTNLPGLLPDEEESDQNKSS